MTTCFDESTLWCCVFDELFLVWLLMKAALTNSVEAIDMKLTQEGFVFCLLTKIERHDSFGKFIGHVDTECLSMGLPRDDAFIAYRGHVFKHVVEFDRKWEL